MMEIVAIPPMMPPAIGPAFELLPFGVFVGVEAADGVLVELEDALAEDVYTLDAPKIAPGPYSGLSI
jgi:hypothetical protein